MVEIMVSALIVSLVTIGTLTLMATSYEYAEATRRADNARNILQTYADQFLRLETTKLESDNVTYTRWLFNVTPGPTCIGLNKDTLSDVSTKFAASTDDLIINLGGDGGNGKPARITRDVRYIQSTSGVVINSRNTVAAGYLLQATFNAEFPFPATRKTKNVSIIVLRAVP